MFGKENFDIFGENYLNCLRTIKNRADYLLWVWNLLDFSKKKPALQIGEQPTICHDVMKILTVFISITAVR